ncbi:MAG: hypothetical protein L0Z62_26500 [Gemmataceae bacterium]|nr:hypothetical protein [Gemmataceae bacterium]
MSETSNTTGESLAFDTRLRLLQCAVAVAMLCGLLLSPKLWLNGRTYPLTPIWDGWPIVPPPWDWLVFGTLLALLVVLLLAPRPGRLILLFVGLAGLWALGDQTRWQPWFYQYLFMLLVVGWGMTWPPQPEQQDGALNACRLIVASMYLWSGAQKFNASYVTDIHPWLLDPVMPFVPEGLADWVRQSGWYVPFLEGGLGVLLLIGPLRLVGVGLALGMHALILFSLGPLGHNWNTIVWPWNLAMMAFVLILFVGTREVTPWSILWPGRFRVGWVTAVLFGVMPLLNFFDWWDSYLSAALYSGNVVRASAHVSVRVKGRLPPEVQTQFVQPRWDVTADPDLESRPYEVDFLDWSITELNVPYYPARRVYRQLARKLALLGDSAEDVVLIVQERPDWSTGKTENTREDAQVFGIADHPR